MRKYVDGMVDPRQGKFDSGDGLIIFSRNRVQKTATRSIHSIVGTKGKINGRPGEKL